MTESEDLASQYQSKFDPKAFLEEFYSDRSTHKEKKNIAGVSNILISIISKAHQLVSPNIKGKTSRFMDIGSGPTITGAAFGCIFFDELYLAELVESSRCEVQKFLQSDADAFDWLPYISHLAPLLGKDAHELIDSVRHKVADVLDYNGLKSPSINNLSTKVHCVLSNRCLDNISTEYRDYEAAICDVYNNILENGGCLVITGFTNESSYVVGHVTFRKMSLTLSDVENALIAAGFMLVDSKELVEHCQYIVLARKPE